MKELVIAVGLLGLAILLVLIQPQFPRVPFETIAIGEESGIRTQKALVITDQTQWEELWQQHMSNSRRPSPLPQVDFAKEMVIAVFGGSRSEGHILRITRIERGSDKLIVHYTLAGPACTKCSLPTGMAQPYHIVRLERLELPVVFRRD